MPARSRRCTHNPARTTGSASPEGHCPETRPAPPRPSRTPLGPRRAPPATPHSRGPRRASRRTGPTEHPPNRQD
ncbi:hypothetical protein B5181_03825 [Streptomyces sp. 4F]|nr:hypothetical protein B5181_03825 [Streptomyces sp. 4F]